MPTRFRVQKSGATSQRQEKLDYGLDQLNKDLRNSQPEAMSVSIEIQTHEYPAHVERWVTQADVGLLVSFVNHMNQSEKWCVPWLLQAKRLHPDRNGYSAESKFRAADGLQAERMRRLHDLVGPFLIHLLYCPRPSALDARLRTELSMLRRAAFRGPFLMTPVGMRLLSDLSASEPTTEAGVFVTGPGTTLGDFKSVHARMEPLWTLRGTCPLAWFVLSHFCSPRGIVLRTGLESPEREVARRIVEGKADVLECLRQLNPSTFDPPNEFRVFPAHTIVIEMHYGPVEEQQRRRFD